jgi:hypothetical protein
MGSICFLKSSSREEHVSIDCSIFRLSATKSIHQRELSSSTQMAQPALSKWWQIHCTEGDRPRQPPTEILHENLSFLRQLCFAGCDDMQGPPLWSRGQNSWLQIQRSWVPFPALPDVLRSSGSGTGYTQTHEDNCGITCKKK